MGMALVTRRWHRSSTPAASHSPRPARLFPAWAAGATGSLCPAAAVAGVVWRLVVEDDSDDGLDVSDVNCAIVICVGAVCQTAASEANRQQYQCCGGYVPLKLPLHGSPLLLNAGSAELLAGDCSKGSWLGANRIGGAIGAGVRQKVAFGAMDWGLWASWLQKGAG